MAKPSLWGSGYSDDADGLTADMVLDNIYEGGAL